MPENDRNVRPLAPISSNLPVPGPELGDPQTAKTVQEMLMSAHLENARRPIEGPDEQGAFPVDGERAWGLISAGVPPVALDANPLRNDVIRACRTGRTVLITAANVGALRLYAASHVVEEVGEHGERWALETGDVSPIAFRTRWEEEYLPLVRIVRNEDLSVNLLSGKERKRVARLAVTDPDDVPSVILALALGAFFLSEDHDAVRAVYGDGVDLESHRAWLEVLRCSGNAGELGKMVFAASMLPALTIGGTVELGRWVSRRVSPWALLPICVGLASLAYRYVSKEQWTKARKGMGRLAMGYLHVYNRYQKEYERFRAAAPPTPGWGSLAKEIDRRALLCRACMHTLARSPGGLRSASELAAELPLLGVGQGETLVREVLRDSCCFDQPYAGRWQLGTPAQRGAAVEPGLPAGTAVGAALPPARRPQVSPLASAATTPMSPS